MVELKPKKVHFDYAKNKGQLPNESHYDTIIDEDCNIYDGDKLVCAYRKLPSDILKQLTACTTRAKCAKSARTRGVQQMSAVYGALPRVSCREDYCRFSAQTKAQPEVFNSLSGVGRYLWGVYLSDFPEVAKAFELGVKEIEADWKKTGAPFTTINVNKNFAIGFHKDAANFSGVYSNVLITKKNTEGGLFVMPEYRVALKQAHGALVIVDGVTVPHGVTKIEPTDTTWERSSVVFYTLRNLTKCNDKKGELLRSKHITTERARKRAAKINDMVKNNDR